MSYGGPPQGYGGPPQRGYGGPPQGYGGPPQQQQMAPQGYGGHPQQQQGYGGQSQQQMPPQNQQRPGSSYQRRAGGGGFVAGSTMGPAGTVDFASLANSSGGMWSDPDFRPDNSSLWIDERQPGLFASLALILSCALSLSRSLARVLNVCVCAWYVCVAVVCAVGVWCAHVFLSRKRRDEASPDRKGKFCVQP